MKRFIVFVALALLFTSSTAHANWYPINTSGETTLYGIESFGDSSLAVVGSGGTIYKSTDDGDNWTDVGSPTTEDLMSVSVGGTRWFAVGTNGTVLRSIDGGDTVEIQPAPTSEDLHDIDMINMNDGTAVGKNGTVLHTGNSGLSWTKVDSEQMSDFFGVWHVSVSTIWAVGEDGKIITSTNEGVDWSLRNSGTTEQLNDVLFANSASGYAVGNNGTMLRTVNGGTVWTEVDLPIADEDLFAIDLFDETNLLIAGDGVILSSDDLGLTWDEELYTNDHPNFYDLATHDGGFTWAVGEDTFSGFIDFFDVTPPSMPENLQVVDGPVVDDSTPTFTWDASTDPYNEVDHYVIMIDDNSWESDTTSFTVPTSLADGDYDVFVSAVDEARNEGVAASTSFVIEGGFEPVPGVDPETLIKLTCTNSNVNDPCRAVYYYDGSGARHAFPNEKAFFTWFPNFDDVNEISSSTMSQIPLGANVTYRPGVKMVKFVTVNTVYAVEGPNVLRAIDSEEIAEDLYGSNWNQQIDDISDAFFSNYDFGDDINDASDYDKDDEMDTYDEVETIF